MGLPTGAVAGIAVGASLAAAALAVAAWQLLRRARAQRRGALPVALLPSKSMDCSTPSGGPSARLSADAPAGGPAMVHHDGQLWSVAIDSPSLQPLQSPFSAMCRVPVHHSSSGSASGSSGSAARPLPDVAAAAAAGRPHSGTELLLPSTAAAGAASMPGTRQVLRSGSAPMLARPPRPPAAPPSTRQPHSRTGLPPLPVSGAALHLASSGLLQSGSLLLGRTSLGTSPLCGALGAAQLVEHAVAESEASAALTRLSRGSSELSESQQLGAAGLPPRLREWLVDPAEVEFLRHPDGSLVELGAGAR